MAVDIPSLNDTKPIVYISSPLINIDAAQTSSNDYFVQLLTLIVQKIHDVIKADVVVKLSKSTSSDDQVALIEEIFSTREKKKYSGVILSPVNVSHAWVKLREYIHSLDDYKLLPIITIDKQIPKPVNEPANDIVIPSVTSNWEDGGKCAAKLILQYLKDINDNNRKNILYMPGLEGSEERIAGFTKVLSNDRRGFALTRLPDADFTRENARVQFSDYLQTNKNVVDFVFACNDEMALGIRDAILEARTSLDLVQDTKVIGFDGTREFTAAMDSENDDILLATIDVNLESQVDKLVLRIHELFSTTKTYTSTPPPLSDEEFIPKISKHFPKIISDDA